jgi:hypothetical protein
MMRKTVFAGLCLTVLMGLGAATSSAQPLTIMTACPLAQATVGASYRVTFAAVGGILPYEWQIVPDGPSPLGLSLDRYTGVFSGTPSQPGAYRFSIYVRDHSAAPREGLRSCSLTVNPASAGARLTITTPCPLPIARAGIAYSAAFTASGGAQPYRWQITSYDAFPKGLTLDAVKGELAGVADAAGQYGFTLAVTDSSGGRDQKACLLPVEPPLAPDTRLAVSPASLTLEFKVGWTASAQATLSVAAALPAGTAAQVSFSIAASTDSGGAWLAASPASGNSPSNVVVFADGRGLSPGVYSGYLSITATGVVNSPERVAVKLVVTGPQLVVSPATISASRQLGTGGESPIVRRITVSSSVSEAPIQFSAALDASAGKWVAVSAIRGTTPQELELRITPEGLTKGAYTTTLTLTPDGAASVPVKVPVTLTVRELPALVAAPAALTFTYQKDWPLPDSQNLTVASRGANFNVSVSTPDPVLWLSVDSMVGVTPAVLRVTADPHGLYPGAHSATIRIALAADDTIAQTIPVKFDVLESTKMLFSPSSILLQGQAGSAVSAPREFLVWSTGSLIDYSVVVDGVQWLSVSPSRGTTGMEIDKTGSSAKVVSKVSVSGDATALKPGTYKWQFTLRSSTGETFEIPVTMNVSSGILKALYWMDGDGWSTTFNLINTDVEPADFTIRFRAADGRPALVSIPDSEPAQEIRGTIAGRGFQSITTAGGTGDAASGWAEITANRAVDGTIELRRRKEGLTELPAIAPLGAAAGRRFLLPYDGLEGARLRVFLLAADDSLPVGARVVLRDENGQSIDTQTLELAPGVEKIVEIPSSASGAAPARGIVEVSSQDGEIHVAALRIAAGGGIAAVKPFAAPGGDSTPVAQVLPRFTNGSGWTTALTLVNTGSEPLPAAVIFREPNGNAVPVALDSGESSADSSDTIPPGGSRLIQTIGEGREQLDGWIEVIGARTISPRAVLRKRAGGGLESEVGVSPVQPGRRQLFTLFDNTEGLNAWLGFANSDWADDSTIAVTFLDERGLNLGSGSFLVRPRSSQIIPLPARIPLIQDRRGLATIQGYNLDLSVVGALSDATGAVVAVPLLEK